MHDVTFALIQEAVQALHGVAHVTPVVTSQTLDEISGARVVLKCENFQRADALKFRGAYHAVSRWVATSSQRTFVTVSSGNHAQGLALGCQLLGCTAHVAMPKTSSPVKRDAVQAYGALIHETEDRARAISLVDRLAQELPAVIIHPFDDPLVIAGQGTIMVELLEQVADLSLLWNG
jgi:threonine dehydratase